MSDFQQPAAPGWQTEELQDEWVDLEPEVESDDEHNLTRSISLTAPLATHIHTNSDLEKDLSPSTTGSRVVGTFLIREDVPKEPLLPKTPGRNKKGYVKDIFTPLPLERMFEPPSPPSSTDNVSQTNERRPTPFAFSNEELHKVDSREDQDDEIIETDIPNMSSFHGRKARLSCQFTFTVPKDIALHPSAANNVAYPLAQSTPTPPLPLSTTAPATDPRLRLFQFQYDTYTREHLSAMVDSIAINTPSANGAFPSPTASSPGLTHVSEATGSDATISHLRSTKRIKLSPASDFYGEGAGSGASISRPKIYGKDYVGESRSLMQQIKQARDFSTISTVASARQNSFTASPGGVSSTTGTDQNRAADTNTTEHRSSLLQVPENLNSNSSISGSSHSKASSYSSSTYRQQAAALMAQIKSDMKGQKRIFSGDTTDLSYFTAHVDEKSGYSRRPSPDNTSRTSQYILEEKENNSRRRSRLQASPRNLSIRKSSSGEHIRELSINVMHMSINSGIARTTPRPTIVSEKKHPPSSLNSLAPPSYPFGTSRSANDDLNRFVSSSTASGTTLTAGNAPSFVKHPGPAQIRTIAPGDLPELPNRLGDMLYDKVKMRWVKSATPSNRNGDKSAVGIDEISEDPFGDIESLKDDSRSREQEIDLYELPNDARVTVDEMSCIEERSEINDEEELELTSFSTDASMHVVSVMTGIDGHDCDDTTDSDEDDELDDTITRSNGQLLEYDSCEESVHQETLGPYIEQVSDPPQALAPPVLGPTLTTPSRSHLLAGSTTPVIRSALKSHSATPTSALKDPNRHKYQTPLHRGHRRSVSFSDGKRDGPIRDLKISMDRNEISRLVINSCNVGITSSHTMPSARSKRIADMMQALEDSDFDEDNSPSKASSSGRPEELQSFGARHATSSTADSAENSPRRTFTRSCTHRPAPTKGQNRANGTFLTECSFGVAHDRLVEVITDVQPFEPYWEGLNSIDLSHRKLESAARLKEFLPRLDVLNLNSNSLSWLSGIPGTVRTLSVASNNLSGITSYSHLLNLENLDISHNEIDSLRQLECLRHLRELKADGNKLTSIDGLQCMDGLVKLSLQNNSIKTMDLAQYRWSRLEMLDVSHNRLCSIHGLVALQSLVALNLDNNVLGDLGFNGPMPKLRILRVSGNRLHQLNVAGIPNVRTLYADNNGLTRVDKVGQLTKLENLSVRNQSGRGFKLLTRDVRDVKRLYLSGNPLKTSFLEEPCYNLVYLELAACRLTALPEGLSGLVPNLRVLNLNYNFLEDARPLEGLTRLHKLTIIGSRLKNTKPLIRLLQRMPEVEMLDFRMNPCTLGWYLPLLVKDVPGALQPSEGVADGRGEKAAAQAWQELDCKFRRDLPDESYIGRLAYRGLIMRACPRIRMVDGVGVSEKERRKAHQLLERILGHSQRRMK